MENKEENVLTPSQLTFIIIASIIGVSVLNLPRSAIKSAKQDGWIAVLIGSIYPIYMIVIANYMRKKHPKEDILDLNKNIYGKFFGNIFNLVFILFFFIIGTDVAAGISNAIRIYIVNFLGVWNILTLLFLVSAYAVYSGTKALGRLNEILFYITFLVYLVPFFSIQKSHISNMQPIFGAGVQNILKGIKETTTAYSGIEILFIVYPFVDENVSIKKIAFKSVAFISIIYTLFTLITILYLGVDAALKFLWPLVTVTESIEIPIINSFRYIFLSLWTMTMIKCITVHYYLVTYGFSKIFTKVSRKNWVLLFYPVMVIVSSLYGNPAKRRTFLDMIFPPYAAYNIIFVSITAILIALGKGDKREK
ncbi:GerAB/ArcD/ProY family transporter [Clostridium lundense]|uniref:GerAB/ArcD/ProY family transporter n=1 Tax=Clostridium lundense TaxID=319475 RepID=UPI0004828B00|nr:GerAB/ArcD/ProY family transporter [Clostridium lundense]